MSKNEKIFYHTLLIGICSGNFDLHVLDKEDLSDLLNALKSIIDKEKGEKHNQTIRLIKKYTNEFDNKSHLQLTDLINNLGRENREYEC